MFSTLKSSFSKEEKSKKMHVQISIQNKKDYKTEEDSRCKSKVDIIIDVICQ